MGERCQALACGGWGICHLWLSCLVCIAPVRHITHKMYSYINMTYVRNMPIAQLAIIFCDVNRISHIENVELEKKNGDRLSEIVRDLHVSWKSLVFHVMYGHSLRQWKLNMTDYPGHSRKQDKGYPWTLCGLSQWAIIEDFRKVLNWIVFNSRSAMPAPNGTDKLRYEDWKSRKAVSISNSPSHSQTEECQQVSPVENEPACGIHRLPADWWHASDFG